MNSAGESSALPPVSSAGLEAALRSFQSGCLAEAERQLRLLEEAEPGRAEVAALLGQVLRAARRWPEAIACSEQALSRDPGDPEPLIAIGQLHRLLGDSEAARSCFEQAVLLSSWIATASPRNAGALADLGLAYAELDDTDQAIEALRAALDLDPCLPEAHLRLGALLVKLGRLSEAEACFAALQATNSGDLQALGQGAMVCQAAGRLEECLVQLEAGMAVAPADWNLIYGLLFACSTGGEAMLPRLHQMASEHWQRLRPSLPPAPDPLPLTIPPPTVAGGPAHRRTG